MYWGEFSSRLDEKGRITVPRRFREAMNTLGHFVWYLTVGYDGALFMFHREEWERLCKRARAGSSIDPDTIHFRRVLFGSAFEVRPDNQGRVPIPETLRDHAGLNKETVIIGLDGHIEVWDRDAWRAYRQQQVANLPEMAKRMVGKPGAAEASAEEKGGSSDAD
jgi:MraZ protein